MLGRASRTLPLNRCSPKPVREEAVVVMSIRVMSSGRGYEYLLKSVAAGDGDRSMSTALTRYYTCLLYTSDAADE